MEAHAKEGRLACLKKGAVPPVKENLPDREKGQVRDKLAETIGVSGRTYDALVKTPELVDAVREKRVGASTAADIADLPKDTQGEKEILRKAKEIRAGTERIERILEVRLFIAILRGDTNILKPKAGQ